MNKDRLSKQEYWEGKYQIDTVGNEVVSRDSLVKKYLGIRIFNKLKRNYSESLLWDNFFKKYLPQDKNIKVLEVGSAPGSNLIKMHRNFGYEPFGVEYTQSGVQVNKQVFVNEGLNPKNIIHADFFSQEFQGAYKEVFDVIYSGGFIEHFTDVEYVINSHISLVKPGGIVVIGIPNLRGFNYMMTYLLSKSILAIHNLEIMDRDKYLKLFKDKNLELLLCDYYGTLNMELFFTNNRFLKKPIQYILSGTQMILNLLFNWTLAKQNVRIENKYFSPYLIYIGKKK